MKVNDHVLEIIKAIILVPILSVMMYFVHGMGILFSIFLPSFIVGPLSLGFEALGVNSADELIYQIITPIIAALIVLLPAFFVNIIFFFVMKDNRVALALGLVVTFSYFIIVYFIMGLPIYLDFSL